MSELRNKGEKTVEAMQKQMMETLDQMQKDIANQARLMRLKVDESLDKGRGKVREKPLTYMGLALGIGVIAGAVLVMCLKRDRE